MKRLYLRAGEVATLFGLDASQSEWKLFEKLTRGEDDGAGDYGRWQGRLSTPIMQGICEDHSLKPEGVLEPRDSVYGAIMPSKAWRIGPKLETGGRPSVLVVGQRSGAAMREWKQPASMPARSRMRYEAIATAYDVDDVLVGVLIDGYSSQLFHVHVDAARRTEIKMACDRFIADVSEGNEPDLDFTADAGDIRKGIAITKMAAAAEVVEALIAERRTLANDLIPVDASIKRIEGRIREIDTNLIHLAGANGKIDLPKHIVSVERDARGTARVTVTDKAPAPLF